MALAYTLFHAFARRQRGGFAALQLTLTSLCDILTRDFHALDERGPGQHGQPAVRFDVDAEVPADAPWSP